MAVGSDLFIISSLMIFVDFNLINKKRAVISLDFVFDFDI
jgi:hypothetical protein